MCELSIISSIYYLQYTWNHSNSVSSLLFSLCCKCKTYISRSPWAWMTSALRGVCASLRLWEESEEEAERMCALNAVLPKCRRMFSLSQRHIIGVSWGAPTWRKKEWKKQRLTVRTSAEESSSSRLNAYDRPARLSEHTDTLSLTRGITLL